jgi:hypothetical protein
LNCIVDLPPQVQLGDTAGRTEMRAQGLSPSAAARW